MLFLFRFFLFFASELSVVVLGKLILSEESVPALVFLAGMAFLVFLRAFFFSGRPELVFFSARFSAGSLCVVLTFLCDFTENSLAEKFSSGDTIDHSPSISSFDIEKRVSREEVNSPDIYTSTINPSV